jgi:hypothetical protein
LVLRGPREQGIGEKYITMSFMICTPHKALFGKSNQEECGEPGVQYVFGEERCIQGFGGKPGGKRPLA